MARCAGNGQARASVRIYIAPHRDHVNLDFYYGVSLPQADTCLVGDAKRMPHIKVRSAADVRTSSLRRLLRAALAR